MFKQSLTSLAAFAALVGTTMIPGVANAQPTPMASPVVQPSGGAMSGNGMANGGMSGAASEAAASGNGMSGMSTGMQTGPDHGMPAGKQGGDGARYTGAPDLQAAISLVTAGGPPGQFSIAAALTALAGADTANAEVAKLTKQYGAASFGSFVAVQNFAVNDAVKIATAAGVKFPSPTLKGADLAKRVVTVGLIDNTYYEGYQLDHLVTNKIHEQVMNDIDQQYGVAADANYHKIADQAHYDLAQALGVKTVQLAPFH